MRCSEGRIDHPSLSQFPLAGASGSPKMLPIWMISRVGETDLRAFSPISRVWGPRIGPFWGKGSPYFLLPREKLTSNSTIFEALARLEIRFRDLGGREKAGYIFWLYFLLFLGTLRPFQGPVGEGRLKEGVGGGLIDLSKIRDLKRSQISGPK